jgi:RNA polymerase sigma factor (sigma-70 family)
LSLAAGATLAAQVGVTPLLLFYFHEIQASVCTRGFVSQGGYLWLPNPSRMDGRSTDPASHSVSVPSELLRPLRNRAIGDIDRISVSVRSARESAIGVAAKQHPALAHPRHMRAEGEVVLFPAERVEARARFDEFFEDEHERLFKALYFVTGNRQDAEELMQDAFMKLWERWDQINRISDPTGYLFRVALNGFRMRRRRAATAVRKLAPVTEERDLFAEAEMRADVRRLLLGLTVRQRAALLLVDLLGYPSEQAARILRVRPSTVRALATQGRRALRAKEGARDA